MPVAPQQREVQFGWAVFTLVEARRDDGNESPRAEGFSPDRREHLGRTMATVSAMAPARMRLLSLLGQLAGTKGSFTAPCLSSSGFEYQDRREVALHGELRRIASIALVASLVKGEDTGLSAVLAARCVDELFEQIRAEDEV